MKVSQLESDSTGPSIDYEAVPHCLALGEIK